MKRSLREKVIILYSTVVIMMKLIKDHSVCEWKFFLSSRFIKIKFINHSLSCFQFANQQCKYDTIEGNAIFNIINF
jgi:hypothetical protein